jgi:signal transduction histidine kinase
LIKKWWGKFKEQIGLLMEEIGSLNVSLVLFLILGLLLATATYFTVEIVSTAVIEEVYLSEESKCERVDAYAEDLQTYVIENGISYGNNLDAFEKWMKNNDYVRLSTYEIGNDDFDEYNVKHIKTADGKSLIVVIDDHTEKFFYELFSIIKIVAAVVVLFAIMIVHIQNVTVRVRRLAREVGYVADGDTAHHVNMSGYDEITALSRSVEQMRVSILAKIESERKAIEANSELITSMSHDIRTPLTVLLGYIDMMKERAEDDPMMKDYVLASEKTALRLKRLSDDLFNYFLLFGKSSENINISEYNFGVLVEQMLSEYVFLLHERGYNVDFEIDAASGKSEISTDPDFLMRIFENLFSNMFKYASRDEIITIRAFIDGEVARITFRNTIDKSGEKVETNGIGLKSCRKIADTLGVEMSVENDGDVYETHLGFKAYNN